MAFQEQATYLDSFALLHSSVSNHAVVNPAQLGNMYVQLNKIEFLCTQVLYSTRKARVLLN